MYSKVEEVPQGWAPVLKVKSTGRIDLGVYKTARQAAVAHDVARLICLHEKRPDTDLRLDNGLMHPVEGYLVDPAFTQLIESKTSFTEVCELLKAGVLADTFLCAQDRQTRSNTSGERPAPSQRRQQQTQPAQPQRSNGGAVAQPAAAPAVAATPVPPVRAAAPTVPAAGEAASAKQQEAAPSKQAPQPQQPQQQSHKSSADTQQALPPTSPYEVAGAPAAVPPAAAVEQPTDSLPAATSGGMDEAGAGPSPVKKKTMRWLEWPTKGGGQFVSCISERALKSSMTLPAKMKRELFQVTQSPAAIAAYDLQPGSTQRWNWEVRDYQKDERRVTSIHNLGPFFKHYGAVPGDVMVVVASAPGAVKVAIWKGDSKEAAEFNAFQERQAEKAAEKQSRQGAGSGGGRKRAVEVPADKQGPAKAPKSSAGKAPTVPSRSGVPPPSFSPEGSRPPSKCASAPQRPPQQASVQQQQQQQRQPQPQAGGPAAQQPSGRQQQGAAPALPRFSPPLPRQPANPRTDAMLALAESGVDPSHPSGEETQALSPTGQVAQSPYRHQPELPPVASTAVAIKQEQQERGGSPPEPGQEQEQELEQQTPDAAGAAGNGSAGMPPAAAAAPGAGAAVEFGGGATHSPARMSCADAPQLLGLQQAAALAGAGLQQHTMQQQQALSQPAASGAGAIGIQQQLQELPDALVLANDEAGVYVAMSRLLNLVASAGRVPPEAVSSYRRSFMRLDPHGKRWFAYDSLKQLVDAAEWADVHEWLLCK